MKSNLINKLENTDRLRELAPKETLINAGFKEDMVLCDIGAGTGVFTFEAANISKKTIYALELSDELIKIIEDKKAKNKNNNVEVKKVDNEKFPVDDKTCDMVLMATVFHELKEPEIVLAEIKRMLKSNGKILIIEFHKKDTPMGPPENHRISEESVEKICAENGFIKTERFILGENFYALIFQ